MVVLDFGLRRNSLNKTRQYRNIPNRISHMKGLRILLTIAVFCSLQGCGYHTLSLTRKSFTLAIWNIGNFSNGATSKSTIDIIKNPDVEQKYYHLINKKLSPDVFVLNEYDPVFYKDREGKDVFTDTVLFDSYKYRFVGPNWWKCNAIFSRFKIKNLEENNIVCYFTAHKSIKDDVKVSKRKTYYLETLVDVRGSCIKIVVVHIDHSQTVSSVYQQAQIAELIEKYKDEKQLIICGDFNTHNLSKFQNAGYSIANDGTFKTYPSKGHAIDNVVYKGVKISNVHMQSTTLSDHNPLICKVTL